MTYKKIPYTQSAPVFQRFKASDAALECAPDTLEPAAVVAILQEHKLYIDLVNFLCHGLPMREVIWWACLALELRMQDWTPEQQRVIRDAKSWVMEPEEVKRRLAEQQVAKLGHKCGPGWLAQAVFWNGSGSIVAADQPVVMPPDFLYAKAAAGAINTAAVLPKWKGYEDYYARVIAMGINLAEGGRGTE